ncbi:unnamed protein product, partial [Amoebophrya sp. A120]
STPREVDGRSFCELRHGEEFVFSDKAAVPVTVLQTRAGHDKVKQALEIFNKDERSGVLDKMLSLVTNPAGKLYKLLEKGLKSVFSNLMAILRGGSKDGRAVKLVADALAKETKTAKKDQVASMTQAARESSAQAREEEATAARAAAEAREIAKGETKQEKAARLAAAARLAKEEKTAGVGSDTNAALASTIASHMASDGQASVSVANMANQAKSHGLFGAATSTLQISRVVAAQTPPELFSVEELYFEMFLTPAASTGTKLHGAAELDEGNYQGQDFRSSSPTGSRNTFEKIQVEEDGHMISEKPTISGATADLGVHLHTRSSFLQRHRLGLSETQKFAVLDKLGNMFRMAVATMGKALAFMKEAMKATVLSAGAGVLFNLAKNNLKSFLDTLADNVA